MEEMEYFDIVDESGARIGIASREECHSGSFLLHPVVHVLAFTGSGELILQKRADTKIIQPGKWDTSVGGHIQSGETVENALAREAFEELGISGVVFERLYSYIMISEVERELVTTFRCQWDSPVIFPENEISEVRKFSTDEIESLMGTGCFTPNFEEEWRYFLAWLANRGNAQGG